MSMSDKAVSTEDLCAETQRLAVLPGVARLEAIIHTLVENKVEALKNDNRKASSVSSSSKSIFRRLKLRSTSTDRSQTEEVESQVENEGVKKKKDHHIVNVSHIKKHALKQEVSISSAESQPQCRVPSCQVSLNSAEDERNRALNYDNIYIDNSCSSLAEKPRCCCNRELNRELIHYEDEYASLKIDMETDAIISEDALRRARRKRRRRRKRRMKKRLAMHHAHLVDPIEMHDSYKNLTEDELSRRAKWTIVATACLLLFMCLLLVGITLRMAPIIDEMVSPALELDKICNNQSITDKMNKSDKPNSLQVPSQDNDDSVTSSESSNALCPVHGGVSRSFSMEDLYFSEARQERHRVRSKRRKSTQICRENSRKSHRGSTRRSRHQNHPTDFLNFENEVKKMVATRKNLGELPPQDLLRNNSQRSSRRSSYSYYDHPRTESMSSYKRNSYYGHPRTESMSSYKKKATLSMSLPEEELLKYKRRRKIVTVIIVTFGVLVFICILAVLVSLTHRSTVTVIRNNSTVNVTYYTFSPHAGVVCEHEDKSLCSKGE